MIEFSNILVNDFVDNIDIDIYYDINTIYKARNNRLKTYSNNSLGEIREETNSMICYEKIISDSEYILLIIQNDILGLRVYFYEYENDQLINDNLDKETILSESEKFDSLNMIKLLDVEIVNKELNLYKAMILDILK
ncbi:MAG: hypothetical protein U9N59_12405 [Campylobacterota bacterium]|nr:hypothetical protein [Campylobacterota bacterium]